MTGFIGIICIACLFKKIEGGQQQRDCGLQAVVLHPFIGLIELTASLSNVGWKYTLKAAAGQPNGQQQPRKF